MKTNSSYIFLKEIRYYAYHGVIPQEKLVGNEYIVDLKLKVDISQAAQTDDVCNTVNYAEVCQAVKDEMMIPSKLIEHVSRRIVESLFSKFTTIEEIDIRVAKRNPPMGADIDVAGVEMHCSRAE